MTVGNKSLTFWKERNTLTLMPLPVRGRTHRWKRVKLEERRRIMAEVTKVRSDRANARKLIEALERVKAAGYQVQPPPPLEMAS